MQIRGYNLYRQNKCKIITKNETIVIMKLGSVV
jgi:hypothetical protein